MSIRSHATDAGTIRRRLRERLAGGDLIRAMSAHNPLSAMLAQEAGFDAIWASGFELSAAFGLPDASLITMSQHVEMTRAIADRVSVPILADVDTGYGNAINVIRTVEQYERAGVAAIVMEDKTFPKDTSLRRGGGQALARVEEFEGKIAAALDGRRSPDFLVVARCEALIAGQGQAEALDRCARYAAAGANAILIHSKAPTPDEVLAFAEAWDGAVPLVLVPTAYPQLDEVAIQAIGKVGIVIYGNHALRAAVAAMQDVFARIRRDGGSHGLGDAVVPVQRLFDLQGMDDLAELERRYLK